MDNRAASPDTNDTGPALAASTDLQASLRPAQTTDGTIPTPTAAVETKFERSQLDAKGGFASIGHELDETAPLWRVYRDEVRSHDQTVTLDEWNKTLDVLLIFAGLFSAVVTTFVVATFPLLNPQDDNVAMAVYALARSINNATMLPAPEPARPATTSSLWVNGLWFTSLFVALADAFFAILAKQWLVEYNHRMADPPATGPVAGVPSATTAATATPTASLTWARRRNFFFEGFDKWHIPALITQVLPFLLHIALFLFLVGLALFVWTLSRPIAFGMTALTSLLICLYIVSTVLPMWWWDCPTATPLVRQLRGTPALLIVKVLAIFDTHSEAAAAGSPSRLPPPSGPFLPRRVTRVQTVVGALGRFMRRISEPEWNDQEQTAMSVTCRTLRWLILVSGSESATTTALQSLGTLDPDSIGSFQRELQSMTSGMSALSSLQAAPTAVDVIRAIRSELVLGRGSWTAPLLGLDLTSPMLNALRSSYWPDAQLLSAVLNSTTSRSPFLRSPSSLEPAEQWVPTFRAISAAWMRTQTPPSLPSTALLLMRSKGTPPRLLPYLLALLVTDRSVNDDSSRMLRLCNIGDLGYESLCSVHPEHGPTCDLSCVVSFICRTVDTEDDTDCRIGAWLGAQFVRKHGEHMALHNLRDLRQLFSNRHASHKLRAFLEGGTATPRWLYRGIMVLLSASHDQAIEPAMHILDRSPEDRRSFLEWLLKVEKKYLKHQFVLPPEIWIALLIYFAEPPPACTLTLAELSLLLEGASMLKLKNHADRTVVAILNGQIQRSQATIGPPDIVDPLKSLSISDALPYGERFASTPIPIIETLLYKEVHATDGYFLSSEVWLQVLTDAAKQLSPDAVSPKLLVPLFAGASMLNRRTGSVGHSLAVHLGNRFHDGHRPTTGLARNLHADSQQRSSVKHLFLHVYELISYSVLRLDMNPSRLNGLAFMNRDPRWVGHCDECPDTPPSHYIVDCSPLLVEGVQIRGRFAPLADGFMPVVVCMTGDDGSGETLGSVVFRVLTPDEISLLPPDEAENGATCMSM